MNLDDLGRVIEKLPEPVSNLLKSTFFHYIIGGCIAAGAHLMTMSFAIEWAGSDKENANSMGFVVGVLVNYAIQRRFTFREHARAHAEQIPLFVSFAVAGLFINRFVYEHGLHDFHLQYLIAAIMAIAVVFVFNFTANSLITFRPRRP